MEIKIVIKRTRAKGKQSLNHVFPGVEIKTSINLPKTVYYIICEETLFHIKFVPFSQLLD